MLDVVGGKRNFQKQPVEKLWEKDDDQVLAFKRGDLVFVFNFNPMKSFDGYGILAPEGEYVGVMNTDAPEFGGHGNISNDVKHFTHHDELYSKYGVSWLKLYLPARTAQVLRLKRTRKVAAKPAKKAAAKKTCKKATSKKK